MLKSRRGCLRRCRLLPGWPAGPCTFPGAEMSRKWAVDRGDGTTTQNTPPEAGGSYQSTRIKYKKNLLVNPRTENIIRSKEPETIKEKMDLQVDGAGTERERSPEQSR